MAAAKREALLLDGVREIDGRAHEVRHAHLVHDQAHAADLVGLVAVQVAARLDAGHHPR